MSYIPLAEAVGSCCLVLGRRADPLHSWVSLGETHPPDISQPGDPLTHCSTAFLVHTTFIVLSLFHLEAEGSKVELSLVVS